MIVVRLHVLLDFFSFLIFGYKGEQEDNIYAKNFSGVCFPGKFYHKRKNKKTMVIKCQNSDVVALFQDF